MSYQVLARKWRPRTFAQMVGQEHVVKALCNALDNDRVHHAFLFTGTRGVGKTSVARVLAKALNCERGVSSRPCGECSACQEVDAGRFVDLIEVDAASRTGVDDTRDLLDNVQYTPARGRYKIYLIDEVHMFSRSSFNALLKTLEEPPPHVKFLLATTDPRKLPATVLSRCLQFNLRRLSPSLISEQLAFILEREGIAQEPGSLGLLARSADGSLRDALSLLDEAIAFCGGGLRVDAVSEMLGTIEHGHVVGLLDGVVQRDAAGLLRAVEAIDRLAPDYAYLLGELLTLLQRVAIVQVADQAVNDGMADPAVLRRFAASMTPEDVQLAYQIGLIGKRDLPLSPEPRGGFEMILLRMLHFVPLADDAAGMPAAAPEQEPARPARPAMADDPSAAARTPDAGAAGRESAARTAQRTGLARQALNQALDVEPPIPDSVAVGGEPEADSRQRLSAPQQPPSRDAVTPIADELPTVPGNGVKHDATVAEAGGEGEEGAASPPDGDTIDREQWHRIFAELGLDGVARELAANCILESCGNGRARFILDASHSHLCTAGAKGRLDEAMSRHFSAAIRSEIRAQAAVADTPAERAAERRAERQRQAEQAIAKDPNVQTLIQTFGASIRPSSVTPTPKSG